MPGRVVRRGSLLALIGLICLSAGSPAAAEGPTYRVSAGDTLYELAARYLVSDRGYRDLQRLNRVLDPKRLEIGSLLAIPLAWLKREQSSAQVAALRGSVSVQIGRDRRVPVVGLRIPQRSTVETQDRSFASLNMQDGSELTVLPASRIRIDTLQRVLLTGSLVRTIYVEKGRVQAKVVPMLQPTGTFQLRTPLVVAAVRGTEFRTTYDEATQTSRVEVLRGKVEVVGGQKDLLAAGEGMVVDPNGLGAKQQLLEAPEVLNSGRIQAGDDLHFALRPQPGAASYQALIAADAGFVELLDEVHAAGPEIHAEAPGEGTYFVRVSALTAQNVEGVSRDYAFERRRYAFAAQVDNDLDGAVRRYRFRWQPAPDERTRFRFVLSRDGAGGLPLVDEIGLGDSQIALTDLPAGRYRWKVGRWLAGEGQGKMTWDEEHELTVAVGQ